MLRVENYIVFYDYTITFLLQLTVFAVFRFRLCPWSFILLRIARRSRVTEVFRFCTKIDWCRWPCFVRHRFLFLRRFCSHVIALLLFRIGRHRFRFCFRQLLVRGRWKIVCVAFDPGPRRIRFRVRRQHFVKPAR